MRSSGSAKFKERPGLNLPGPSKRPGRLKRRETLPWLRMFRVATLAPETRPETRERPMLGSRIPQPAAAIVLPGADDLRTDHLRQPFFQSVQPLLRPRAKHSLDPFADRYGETCFRSLEQLERSFTDAQFARECAFVLQSPLCGSITLFPEGGQAFVPSPCGNRPTA